MNARYLLDTHIAVWWLTEPRKLSREQARILREAVRRQEQLALSAISLFEIAVVFGRGSTRGAVDGHIVLDRIETSEAFEILPLDIGVAREVAAIGDSLRDPGDRAIVATARVHRLRLLTSDERIIGSKLVPAID